MFVFDLAHSLEELIRLRLVANARLVVHIFHRMNFERASILSADHTPGLIRRVPARLRDNLLELFACQLHISPTRRKQSSRPQSCKPRASTKSRAAELKKCLGREQQPHPRPLS